MDKVDVTQVMRDLDGKEIKNPVKVCQECGQATETQVVTLRSVFENVLMAVDRGENPSGEEKLKRYELAVRVHREDEVELGVDDRAKLKTLVGKIYAPLIVGQVWNILEE